MKHYRPIGLILFAIINFVLAASCLYALVIAVSLYFSGQSLNTHMTLLAIFVFPVSLLTGIGFITFNKTLGFWLGNVFVMGWIIHSVIFFIIPFSSNLAFTLKNIAYPLILCLFLNLKYKNKFIY